MRHQRVIASIEKPLYNMLMESARNSGISLSLKVRDILKAKMEEETQNEDIYWGKIAESRLHQKTTPLETVRREIMRKRK